ncbi:gamma-glutamylcyclotransferase family protein [Thalassotalea litorea]|uniref:gamma-glutamylcyclotransferase family protein n=1 Tax=Thalassotalea litorea TaxID=2020715 RepID=UPI003735D63E
MYYFAYGSNMSISRLGARVPSAKAIGTCTLAKHDLRFHKASHDGSGKCDAHFTGEDYDKIYGVLFDIDPAEKPNLDWVEGVGKGYDIKEVVITDSSGQKLSAFTYVATDIDATMLPYFWYRNHVLIGAKEANLPSSYVDRKISSINAIDDPDLVRNAREFAIHD